MISKNNLYTSKKADISVVLLVFMTVALCGVALFIFASYDKQTLDKIKISNNVEEINFQVSGFEIYLDNLAKQTVANIRKEGKAVTLEEFSSRFNASLQNASINYFPLFNFQILEGQYVLTEENKIITIDLNNFKFTKQLADTSSGILSVGITKSIEVKIP